MIIKKYDTLGTANLAIFFIAVSSLLFCYYFMGLTIYVLVHTV